MRTPFIQAITLISAMFLPLAGHGQDTTTHMGVRPADHVVLQTVNSLGVCRDNGFTTLQFVRRVLPNGLFIPFGIPDGRVLVLTDFDAWYTHPDGAQAAGQFQRIRLVLVNKDDPFEFERVALSFLELGPQGEAGVSDRFLGGIVVNAAAEICLDVEPGPDGPPSGIGFAILRGYLMDIPRRPTKEEPSNPKE